MSKRVSWGWILGILVLLVPHACAAKLKVVATLSDLGWIAQQVGGEDADVSVLCPGHQDPHYLPAKPSLARKLRKADLLVYNGLELEVGWLPLLVDASRNRNVRPGTKGELDCSTAIDHVLDVPHGHVDRSAGDIHPLGNPHYLLDPRNGALVGRVMAERMAELDPQNANRYTERAAELAAAIQTRLPGWEALVAEAAACPLIIYHQHWEYLFAWLGLETLGAIEHRPGISPSPRHVEEMIMAGRAQECVLVIAATWDNLEIAEKAARRMGAPHASLPGAVGAMAGADGYLTLFDTICQELHEAACGGHTP